MLLILLVGRCAGALRPDIGSGATAASAVADAASLDARPQPLILQRTGTTVAELPKSLTRDRDITSVTISPPSPLTDELDFERNDALTRRRAVPYYQWTTKRANEE
jgi:hypothetical protein